MRFYQLGIAKNGKLEVNEEKMKHMLDNLFDGRYLITYQRIDGQSDIKQYRAYYFAKLDMMAKEVGETRYGLHEYVKEHVLEPLLNELPNLFSSYELSTTSLYESGWLVFLERLDLWAFLTYNIILP